MDWKWKEFKKKLYYIIDSCMILIRFCSAIKI